MNEKLKTISINIIELEGVQVQDGNKYQRFQITCTGDVQNLGHLPDDQLSAAEIFAERLLEFTHQVLEEAKNDSKVMFRSRGDQKGELH